MSPHKRRHHADRVVVEIESFEDGALGFHTDDPACDLIYAWMRGQGWTRDLVSWRREEYAQAHALLARLGAAGYEIKATRS